MKLIFSGNTAWGMYNFRRKVLSTCISKGHKVYVIIPPDNFYEKQIKSLGCEIFTIQIEGKGTNPIKDFILFYEYKKIFKRIKPDACFFYTIKPNIYGGLAARTLNIPYIPITTGLGYTFLNNNLVSKIARFLYKIAFKKAHQVWFLNNEDSQAFISHNIIEKEKAYILKGEGIDINDFEIHNENNKISFLLVARMLWDKGVGEFVEASKILKPQYPNVQFQLLGFLGVNNPSAVSKEQMDKWEKEGYIQYLGSTQDVRPFIYKASCIVLPSKYREGIPFSLMEGAAAGKPLIATNTIGCKDVVTDSYNGYLCTIGDAKSLADAMKKIINMSPEERQQMGLKGRMKMNKEFSIKLIIKDYESAIDQINILKSIS